MRLISLALFFTTACAPGAGQRCGYVALVGDKYVACADGYACYHDQTCDDPDCQGVCLPACESGCAEGCGCLSNNVAWGVCVREGATTFAAASRQPFACER